MARIIRPSWAIRCQMSGCKTLFEVAEIHQKGVSYEVVCPACGEHYLYPPPDFFNEPRPKPAPPEEEAGQ